MELNCNKGEDHQAKKVTVNFPDPLDIAGRPSEYVKSPTRLLVSSNREGRVQKLDLFVLLLVAFFSVLYFAGLRAVPFHPDEATQIYMSSDVDLTTTNLSSLFWQPGSETDPRSRLRLLDAPLTRYLVGLGRQIVSLPATSVDWNWSQSWKQNDSAGAIPTAGQLLVGRIAVSFLYPFTLILIYLSGKRLHGSLAGSIAMILVALNALVALHTRRAMAESLVLFSFMLALFYFLRSPSKAWLLSLPVALAVNSKLTLLPFMLWGAAVLILQAITRKKTFIAASLDLVSFLVPVALLTFLLNPFLWAHPFEAASAAIRERQKLTQDQVIALKNVVITGIPVGGIERLNIQAAEIFFSPPAFEDVANYVAETKPIKERYLINNPTARWRSPIPGAFFLFLCFFGMVLSLTRIMRREILVLWTGAVLELLFLVFLIPVPFQRYSLPLIPFAALWSGYGVGRMYQSIQIKYRRSTIPPVT